MASSSPAALGYRWPAEWEPHRATWLAWPHNRGTWPRCLSEVVEAFVHMTRALAARERVCVTVQDGVHEAEVGRALARGGVDVERNVELYRIPTDDAWIRDHGPLFVVRDCEGRRERAAVCFRFDAWGGKYPPWDRDARVAGRVAAALGVPIFAIDRVLEGGALDGDGRGTLLTTTSCLLHPNRGPGRTREGLEAVLAGALGVRRVVWLDGVLAGDDTDGHVDQIARFVAPRTVVAVTDPEGHDPAAAPALDRNLRRLREARNAAGEPFEVVSLPLPRPVRRDGVRCPASYANFYLANGLALVPVFGAPEDDRALGILKEVLAGRELVPIPSADLALGLGAVHCLTQQEPASEAPDPR